MIYIVRDWLMERAKDVLIGVAIIAPILIVGTAIVVSPAWLRMVLGLTTICFVIGWMWRHP